MSLVNLAAFKRSLADAQSCVLAGKVTRASGIVVEAVLPQVAVGTSCEIRIAGGHTITAEVVGFSGSNAILMPFGDVKGIGEGCPVIPRASAGEIMVGDRLLGRVVNAAMEPLDDRGGLILDARVPLHTAAPRAMTRRRITRPLVLGIRSIDSCLTCGEGQRLGIMAGPGIGKSVLLGMLARSADADVIVVGLVGERGREVREFVERDLGKGLSRSVVVVATGDESPLVRVRAGMAATAVAEFFRDQGKRVLLLIDSLSRVAMAQREIGLAAGEPPTSRGYPPSVFAMLPRLVERAGNGEGQGSITAMYTVLAEGDDLTDPVVDASRAALDGHIVLSRNLAMAGHFPAVDVQPRDDRRGDTRPPHPGPARARGAVRLQGCRRPGRGRRLREWNQPPSGRGPSLHQRSKRVPVPGTWRTLRACRNSDEAAQGPRWQAACSCK